MILVLTSTQEASAPILALVTMKEILIAPDQDDLCIKARSRLKQKQEGVIQT